MTPCALKHCGLTFQNIAKLLIFLTLLSFIQNLKTLLIQYTNKMHWTLYSKSKCVHLHLLKADFLGVFVTYFSYTSFLNLFSNRLDQKADQCLNVIGIRGQLNRVTIVGLMLKQDNSSLIPSGFLTFTF